ncbi:hypothetical protein [Actinocorallia populi]|uniref:hypothetical protein n=1 Tax=Actinocorallia populi TaxID=2079200 RepID=UPI0013001FB5|nr:hypothetical protein [Actinocorallia populi]
MPVVLLLAAVVVVAAAVVLASGRGGELREPVEELPPTGLPEDRLPTGTDAAMVKLPKGVWGYHPLLTDEVLGRLVHALMRRESEVAALERRIAELTAYGPGESLGASWLKKPDEPDFLDGPFGRDRA